MTGDSASRYSAVQGCTLMDCAFRPELSFSNNHPVAAMAIIRPEKRDDNDPLRGYGRKTERLLYADDPMANENIKDGNGFSPRE